METNKVFYIASILFIGACFFSFSVSAHEDVSVEFFFNKPDSFVCEIKNMTDFEMDIRFNHLEDEPLTDIRFDIIGSSKDTVRNVYYQIKLDPPYHVRLDPGQVYTRIFQDGTNWRFIKATVSVKYQVRSPTRRGGSYEKTFDLEELRRKAYQELYVFPITLPSQEDVSVEFSFNKPDTFVCEIKNKTDFKTDIWFFDLEHNTFVDVRCPHNDTVGYLFYQSKLEDLPYHVLLDPGQVFTNTFRDRKNCQLIKATFFIKYQVRSPIPIRGSYEKAFDLDEIRNKAYRQPMQKNEEE